MKEKHRNEWPTIGEIADLMSPEYYLQIVDCDFNVLFFGLAVDLGQEWRNLSVGGIGPYYRAATGKEPAKHGITIWN